MSAADPPAEMVPDTALQARPGDADFDAIFDAVMATDRGRWFLFEYARRNRHADTAMVLAAIERLIAVAQADAEARVAAARPGPDPGRMRAELADMANAVARTRGEIASIRPDGADADANDAIESLDGLIRSTERTTATILVAAGQIQEMAWAMREQGMDTQCCDLLDGRAAAIYEACSLDALNRQRTRKVIHVQRYLEARIQAMMALWDEGPPRDPGKPARTIEPVRPSVVTAGPIGKPMPPAIDRPETEPAAFVALEEAAGPVQATMVEAHPDVPPCAQPDEAVSTDDGTPPESDPDWVIADLRALAKSMARYDEVVTPPVDIPAATPVATPVAIPEPEAVAAEPATEASEPVAAKPATAATEPLAEPNPAPAGPDAQSAMEEPEADDAPGASPQPTLREAARRSTDISEDLFADVMALGEDERTALFS
jgi:hypothetical protein